MEENKQSELISKFDDETKFTDQERSFIEHNYKTSSGEYLAKLITTGGTRLTRKIGKMEVKHFATSAEGDGINFVVLYGFHTSNPLSKKFGTFEEAKEFYNDIIQSLTQEN